MAALKKDKLINLLPQEEFTSSVVGRLLTWALSTFRIMVILVEMVVMLAFFSRFWLDIRSNDLDDKIEQKTAYIKANKKTELEFKDLQKRLTVFSSLTSKEQKLSANLDNITKFLPENVVLESYSHDAESIDLRGNSPNELLIAQFMAGLDEVDEFKDISLMSVGTNRKDQAVMSFDIKILLNQSGGKK